VDGKWGSDFLVSKNRGVAQLKGEIEEGVNYRIQTLGVAPIAENILETSLR
jgi:hypothetical protein